MLNKLDELEVMHRGNSMEVNMLCEIRAAAINSFSSLRVIPLECVKMVMDIVSIDGSNEYLTSVMSKLAAYIVFNYCPSYDSEEYFVIEVRFLLSYCCRYGGSLRGLRFRDVFRDDMYKTCMTRYKLVNVLMNGLYSCLVGNGEIV
jgi:hypothetical protein